MKSKLVYQDGTINGRPETFVTLRSVRVAYRSSLPNSLAARGKNSHADPILWQEELGIRPYAPDGKSKRTCLIASEFHAVADKKLWKEDVEECCIDNIDDEDCSVDLTSVNSVLLQIINQKLDKVLCELGVSFSLDESKLINLNDGK